MSSYPKMYRVASVLALAMIADPAASQVATTTFHTETRSSDASITGDVVVTGRPLSSTRAALAACIARACAPDEDIRASLAHAENQFVAGYYKQARVTLQDAAGRNRRFAKQYPVLVSDLLRASSRVAVHLGEAEDYRRTTLGAIDALKAGLPDGDPQILAERLEVADMFAHLGDIDQARYIYRHVARQSASLHLSSLNAAARLHEAMLDLRVAADLSSSGASQEAIQKIDALANDSDPDKAAYATVARILRAQYDAKRGNPEPLRVVLTQMQTRLAGKRPILLQYDPIKLPGRPMPVTLNDEAPVRDVLTRLPLGDFENQWIDVSFWIKPDGTVEDAGVLRASKPSVKVWDKPVLDSIRSRRYAPLVLPTGDPGILRVERYTYTSFFDRTVTGTRIQTRDGQPRIEMLDLSLDPETPATQSSANSGLNRIS